MARLVHADALIILSDIDGLYDSDPHKDADARLIPVVDEIDGRIRALAGGSGTQRGTGGMVTKLHAAELATEAGIDTIVMNGDAPQDLYKRLEGRQIGTFFKARRNRE